jgi:hypothetical protein
MCSIVSFPRRKNEKKNRFGRNTDSPECAIDVGNKNNKPKILYSVLVILIIYWNVKWNNKPVHIKTKEIGNICELEWRYSRRIRDHLQGLYMEDSSERFRREALLGRASVLYPAHLIIHGHIWEVVLGFPKMLWTSQTVRFEAFTTLSIKITVLCGMISCSLCMGINLPNYSSLYPRRVQYLFLVATDMYFMALIKIVLCGKGILNEP